MEGKGKVEYLLKNYHQIKREIEGKKALMKIIIGVSQEEVIEELNFEKSTAEKVKNSNVPDKTAAIAISYKDVMAEREVEEVRQLKREIRAREVELLKLEAAVDVLDERLQRIIKGIYFERKSRVKLCKELYISEVTLGRWRKNGVEKVATWWKV